MTSYLWKCNFKAHISLVGGNFYCEICNYTTKDIEAVAIHINEDKHKTNKKNPEAINKKILGQNESGFVILDNILINYAQWHGIVGLKCVICNSNINNVANHIALQDHIINLIQAEVQCENGQYYRMMNNDIFQCFTCKSSFPSTLFTEHMTKNHTDVTEIKTEQTKEHSKNKTKQTKVDSKMKSDALELLSAGTSKMTIDTRNKCFDFNVVNKTASCKVCKEVVDFQMKDIIEYMKNHVKMHLSNVKITIDYLDCDHKNSASDNASVVVLKEIQDHGKRRSELSKYGKENFIKLNSGARLGYCVLCDKDLSPHIKIFIQHVNGACHSGHLELKGLKTSTEHEREDYVMIPLNTFIKNLIHSRELKVLWINRNFTVEDYSFMLLHKIEIGSHYKKIKCYACNEIYPQGNEYSHCRTTQHKEKLMAVKVFAFDEEFIREVQPNLYHCGICNQVFPFSENLKKHIRSQKHMFNNKTSKECFFIRHYDELIPSSDNDVMYLQFMIAMFGMH